MNSPHWLLVLTFIAVAGLCGCSSRKSKCEHAREVWVTARRTNFETNSELLFKSRNSNEGKNFMKLFEHQQSGLMGAFVPVCLKRTDAEVECLAKGLPTTVKDDPICGPVNARMNRDLDEAVDAAEMAKEAKCKHAGELWAKEHREATAQAIQNLAPADKKHIGAAAERETPRGEAAYVELCLSRSEVEIECLTKAAPSSLKDDSTCAPVIYEMDKAAWKAINDANDRDPPSGTPAVQVRDETGASDSGVDVVCGKGITSSEPTVMGSLDAAAVWKVIHSHRGQIRFCYESQLERFPKLAGKLAVKFVISASGSVSTSSVALSTVHNAELETCIAGRVRTWTFPKPKGGGLVVATYPFLFSSCDSNVGDGVAESTKTGVPPASVKQPPDESCEQVFKAGKQAMTGCTKTNCDRFGVRRPGEDLKRHTACLDACAEQQSPSFRSCYRSIVEDAQRKEQEAEDAWGHPTEQP